MEYMIQESTLVEIANAVRNKLEYKDAVYGLICDRENKIFSITIPDGITSIGNYVFSSCNNLISITIPDSVTSIGMGAFQHSKKLSSITIPRNVSSIGFYAFYYCDSLTTVYLYPTTPPTLNDVSAISTATTKIYVPVGYGEAYKTATNWSNFADIIFENEDIVIDE